VDRTSLDSSCFAASAAADRWPLPLLRLVLVLVPAPVCAPS
jgi:hypothetical protein